MEQIGSGTYCTVYKAYEDGVPICVKKIDRDNEYFVKIEIYFTKLLNHPNIIKYRELISDKNNFYIITEYGGQDLRSMLNNKQSVNIKIMNDIFAGLAYMHSKNIIHRDIKLDNIVISDRARIIDFNLAVKDSEEKEFFDEFTFYTAPEMLLRIDYSFEVDIWSAGCIAHMLLNDKLPFIQTSDPSLFLIDIFSKLEYPHEWKKVHRYGYLKNLDRLELNIDKLERMLIIDPAKRAKARELLNVF